MNFFGCFLACSWHYITRNWGVSLGVQFSMAFYMNYLARWPDYFHVAEGPNKSIMGYSRFLIHAQVCHDFFLHPLNCLIMILHMICCDSFCFFWGSDYILSWMGFCTCMVWIYAYEIAWFEKVLSVWSHGKGGRAWGLLAWPCNSCNSGSWVSAATAGQKADAYPWRNHWKDVSNMCHTCALGFRVLNKGLRFGDCLGNRNTIQFHASCKCCYWPLNILSLCSCMATPCFLNVQLLVGWEITGIMRISWTYLCGPQIDLLLLCMRRYMNCYVTSYSQLDETIPTLFVGFRGQESGVSFKSMFTEMHTFDQCPLHTNFWTNVCAMACMYINS